MGGLYRGLFAVALLFLQDGVMSTRGGTSHLAKESNPDISELSATKQIETNKLKMVQIEPAVLVFKKNPLCIPSMNLIDIINLHDTEELHILSITSDDSQFHPAIFKPQVLQPDGRASVQIIYLPKTIGSHIDGELRIQTSFGEIHYSIEATAVANPYRLHAFIGTKIPAGVVYSRPIIMYNPTDKPLHVREVFTTESFLTLHLPDELISTKASSDELSSLEDDVEDDFFHPQATLSSPTSSEGSWLIPPKSEKEIIHLVFHASTPGPFNGYVHVKSDVENMVLPVELHVLKGGLHPTPKSFDFGILTSPDERRVVSVSLLNSGNLPIELLDAIPSMHDSSLSIEFTKGLVILPGIVAESVVHLVYSGASPGPTQGKVIVTTNHSNAGLASVEVFYTASVLHGGVGYERNHVSFVVPLESDRIGKEEGPIHRSVPFTNYFTIPLILSSVSVDGCGTALSVGTIEDDGMIALPQDSWPELSLNFDLEVAANELELPHTCTLVLVTNVSTHHIPVHVYDGRLKVSIEELAQNMSCISNLVESQEESVVDASKLVAMPNHRFPHIDELSSECLQTEHQTERETPMSGGVLLEFGKIGYRQSRRRRMNVTNLNPVPVNVSTRLTNAFSSSLLSSTSVPLSLSSKFYYLGQAVSSHASVELVEIYEDMLGQGAIPPSSSNELNLEIDGLTFQKSYPYLPPQDQRVFLNSGKFSILPGHTAVFDIEIASRIHRSNSDAKAAARKQKKDTRKNGILNQKWKGVVMTMETPVETIAYHIDADVLIGNLTTLAPNVKLSPTKNTNHDHFDYNYNYQHGFVPVKLASNFNQDILVCGLVTSRPNWMDITLIPPNMLTSTSDSPMAHTLNQVHRSQECSENMEKAVVLPAKPKKKKSSSLSTSWAKKKKTDEVSNFVDVAITTILPQPGCVDMWGCIGAWAHQVAHPYQDITEVMGSGKVGGLRTELDREVMDQEAELENDLDYLEREDNQRDYESAKIEEMFSSFNMNNDDVRASRMVAKELSSLILSKPPYDLSAYIDQYDQPKLKKDEDVNPISLKEQEDLANLHRQWETFKSLGLNQINAKVSAVTSVGTFPDLLNVGATLDAPKLYIEQTGFGITHVGDVSSEYFTVYNLDTKPLALQLTALADDRLVAFANNKYNRLNPPSQGATQGGENKSSPRHTLQGGHAKHNLGQESPPQDQGGSQNGRQESSEWWNMRLKTVNNGVGTSTQRSKNWRSKQGQGQLSSSKRDLSNVVSGGHVMNLVSATSGQVVSTCALIDGACLSDESGKSNASAPKKLMRKDNIKFAKWGIDPTSLPPGESLYEIAQKAIASQSITQPFYLPINSTKPLVIMPGEKTFIGPIFFRPAQLGSFHATLYLRNNITRIESIDLVGKAGQGKAVVRTKGSVVHHPNEIFTLKFMLNTSFWQPYNRKNSFTRDELLSKYQKSKKGNPEPGSSWFSSLSSNDVKSSKKISSETGHEEDDQDQVANILRGSIDYFEPPKWPNPAIHIVRIENHGNLPIQITDLIVGAKVEPAQITPFGKLFSHEDRKNPCVGLMSGFVVHGCEEVPLTLGPLQAWNVLVAYYADCSTFNDVDALHISTSVGNFDIILQAISKKSDMPLCNAFHLRAHTSTFYVVFHMLVIIGAFLISVVAFGSVKSHYTLLNDSDKRMSEALFPDSGDQTTTAKNKGQESKKKWASKQAITKSALKKNRKWEKGSESSSNAQSDLFFQVEKLLELEKTGGWIESTSSQNAMMKANQKTPKLERSSPATTLINKRAENGRNSELLSSATSVESSSASEIEPVVNLDETPKVEFLVQVENNAKSSKTPSSLKNSPRPPPVTDTRHTIDKTPATSTTSMVKGSATIPSPVVAALLSDVPLKGASPTPRVKKSDTSTLAPSVSALMNTAATISTTNTTSTAKARREKKKQEDRERKEKMESMDKAKKLKEAEKQKKENLKREAEKEKLIVMSKQKEPTKLVCDNISNSSKKKRDVVLNGASSAKPAVLTPDRTSANKPPSPPLPPASLLTSLDKESGSMGIGAGWTRFEEAPSKTESDLVDHLAPPPTQRHYYDESTHMGMATTMNPLNSNITMPSASSRLFGSEEAEDLTTSPTLGPSNLFLGVGPVGSSPLRKANLESNMPSLTMEPPVRPDLNMGPPIDASLFGTPSSFASGIGSGFDTRSLFTPELSTNGDSDVNVDSFFADIGSSIAASLDLDISEDPLVNSDVSSSRLASVLGTDVLEAERTNGNTTAADSRRSRLSHYIKGDSFTESRDGGASDDDNCVPDYHRVAVEVDFFEQNRFFGSGAGDLLDDEGLEDEENYLQGSGDEDNWE